MELQRGELVHSEPANKDGLIENFGGAEY